MDHFVERLHQCAGGPWTLFEGQQRLDQLVLQPPAPISPTDASAFFAFVSGTFQRRLLRCFVGSNTYRSWTLEEIMKQTRPPSSSALQEALARCCQWQMAIKDESSWQGHPRLAVLNNLGWTFEWAVQAQLEHHYHALVRRHVILGEMAALGEIDILALLDDGRVFLGECKSSSKGLTDQQVDRFLAKASRFPAAHALLLIDSDDPHQMRQRLGQLSQASYRLDGNATIGALQQSAGSTYVQVREQVTVADTGGGLLASLQLVLGEE